MKSLEIQSPLRSTPKGRASRYAQLSFAANAGSSLLLSIAVPLNTLMHVMAIIKSAAGTNVTIAPSVVTAGSDQFTCTGHGIQTGCPVTVGFTVGGAVPGGTTANTIYYARAVDANTITLHATQGGAVAGTGIIDVTSAGTTPLLIFSFHSAYYVLRATIRNRFGNTALVGALTTVASHEDIAAWDAVMAANDTTDAIEIKVTPDVTQATVFEVEAEYELVSIAV